MVGCKDWIENEWKISQCLKKKKKALNTFKKSWELLLKSILLKNKKQKTKQSLAPWKQNYEPPPPKKKIK